MRTSPLAALALTASLLAGGCIYSDVRVPLSREIRHTPVVTKKGEATCRSVAWLVGWGDAGLQKAAEQGRLTSLEYADRSVLNVLFGLYMSNTTVVYGN